MDFILNGQATGNVAATLVRNNLDVGCLRPFIGKDGRSYITMTQNGQDITVPLTNATATLRKDDWMQLDDAIVKAAKPRLRAVSDLFARGLTYNIPNGMGKTVLETHRQSDVTPATISMDGLRKSQADRPVFDILNLPLPIIHKDFEFSARQVMASRNGGSPLDTTTAELAGVRVAEAAEQLLLGMSNEYSYGGGQIQGYTNFTSSIPKVLTNPETSGWTPATTVQEVLDMKLKSQSASHYGPWVLYVAPQWDVFMDDDYSAAKGDNTLRERLSKIDGIEEVKTLDYLTGYQMVLVQMTRDVVRIVNGLNLTTVQWESNGGMMLHFKVMAIWVPQLRADQNNRTGIVYGNVVVD